MSAFRIFQAPFHFTLHFLTSFYCFSQGLGTTNRRCELTLLFFWRYNSGPFPISCVNIPSNLSRLDLRAFLIVDCFFFYPSFIVPLDSFLFVRGLWYESGTRQVPCHLLAFSLLLNVFGYLVAVFYRPFLTHFDLFEIPIQMTTLVYHRGWAWAWAEFVWAERWTFTTKDCTARTKLYQYPSQHSLTAS